MALDPDIRDSMRSAPKKELLQFIWWYWVNPKKANQVYVHLKNGMMWNFAFKKVKNNN